MRNSTTVFTVVGCRISEAKFRGASNGCDGLPGLSSPPLLSTCLCVHAPALHFRTPHQREGYVKGNGESECVGRTFRSSSLSRLPRRKKETIEQCHPPSLGCDTFPGVIARPRRREASGGGINGCILGDVSLPATSPPGGGSENPNQQRSNRFRPGCALSTIVPTAQSVRERDQPPRPPSTDTACRPQPPNHFRVFQCAQNPPTVCVFHTGVIFPEFRTPKKVHRRDQKPLLCTAPT